MCRQSLQQLSLARGIARRFAVGSDGRQADKLALIVDRARQYEQLVERACHLDRGFNAWLLRIRCIGIKPQCWFSSG
jgi:hypothetical protein